MEYAKAKHLQRHSYVWEYERTRVDRRRRDIWDFFLTETWQKRLCSGPRGALRVDFVHHVFTGMHEYLINESPARGKCDNAINKRWLYKASRSHTGALLFNTAAPCVRGVPYSRTSNGFTHILHKMSSWSASGKNYIAFANPFWKLNSDSCRVKYFKPSFLVIVMVIVYEWRKNNSLSEN